MSSCKTQTNTFEKLTNTFQRIKEIFVCVSFLHFSEGEMESNHECSSTASSASQLKSRRNLKNSRQIYLKTRKKLIALSMNIAGKEQLI